MTDLEIRDAALARFGQELIHLRKTTRGLKGFSAPPASEWGKALAERQAGLDLLEQMAQTFRFFDPASIWNTELEPDAELDSSSSSLIVDLNRQVKDIGAGIAYADHAAPIYTVSADIPLSKVTLDSPNAPLLSAAFQAVPIPASAQAAPGGDKNLAVWQPSSDQMWEFWHMSKAADGWHAGWGGRMSNVSKSPGYYQDKGDIERSFWGTPGAIGLPLVGGVMTIEELQAGRIEHALQIGIPQPRKGVWADPAKGTDGNLDSPSAVPEGARLRLPASLDVAALDLPRVTRLIAEATQRFGIIVNNVAGKVSFEAEDPEPTGCNPYPMLFEHTPLVSLLLERFPWGQLQVLKMELSG